MRKLIFAGILLALLLSVAFVSAQDEDLTTYALPILATGETATGSFEGTLTLQLYTFSAAEGDVVSITLVQAADSEADPFLILLGPRGEVIAYNDDSLDESDLTWAAAIVDAELPATGSYLVVAANRAEMVPPVVAEDATLEATDYEITMTGASEVEIVDGESSLVGAQAEIGQSGELQVTFAEPVYYLFFSATEGQTVNITTGAATSSPALLEDTMLWVFDRTGARIAAVDDTEDSLYATLSFEASYTGAYMMFATYPFFFLAADAESANDFLGAGAFTIALSEG